ncbi:MAG: hypothetical protein ACRDRA_19755 [Pseudonocardiaceae bacterium]
MLLTTRIFKERRHIAPAVAVSSLAAADAGRRASVARLASEVTVG